MFATTDFLREYLRPRPQRIELRETSYRREGEELPARLYRPADTRRPLPAWVLLHGLTYYGRAHRSLDHFARALAASGTTVIIPEIPEWSALRVVAATTGPSIEGAIETLIVDGHASADRIGVLGFSFGATQALAALADPDIGRQVRAVVAWGGYCDLHHLFQYGLTGRYELDGREKQATPDPYGTWIMGANFVQSMPGHESYGALADALTRLARESGRVGIAAGDAVYDPLKRRLRQDLPMPQRELFDLLAPPSEEWPNDSLRATEFARELANAAITTEARLNPKPIITTLGTNALIAHGRNDRLIPYTESLRLSRTIPTEVRLGCSITSLFAHSSSTTRGMRALREARELFRFFALLHRLLNLI